MKRHGTLVFRVGDGFQRNRALRAVFLGGRFASGTLGTSVLSSARSRFVARMREVRRLRVLETATDGDDGDGRSDRGVPVGQTANGFSPQWQIRLPSDGLLASLAVLLVRSSED